MGKILIIGSKGFIGSHAVQYFSALKATECWGADVVTDYTAANYFLIDSTNSDFNELFETHAFDICINCSGAASVPDSLQHPLRDFSLNAHNVIKILEAIRRHSPLCRFINISSAAVYGNPVKLPIEESDTCKPVSPYGMHKYFAEALCKEYYTYFGISNCSLRIFSAYGEGLKKQLFWDLAQKTTQGNSITLFGSGTESRDFIYVKDIIRAIELIIQKADFVSECYNVANGKEISIKDVAELFLELLQWKGKLIFEGNSRMGDPSNWKADISKLRALGYTPSFTMTDGLKQYAAWLRQ